MKVQIKISPNVIIEAEGTTHVDVFEQIEGLQEVFSAYDKCGKCDGKKLRFVKRVQGKHTYYELHCQSCYARLSFGQNDEPKKGSLYPRRKETEKQTVMDGKLEAGAYLPDNGWIRWDKDKQESK
jgi:hypothetical protein